MLFVGKDPIPENPLSGRNQEEDNLNFTTEERTRLRQGYSTLRAQSSLLLSNRETAIGQNCSLLREFNREGARDGVAILTTGRSSSRQRPGAGFDLQRSPCKSKEVVPLCLRGEVIGLTC